jgi:hypothetical protein
MNLENFFVLDGVGGLLGVPPGGNRGPLGEIIPDLEKVTAPDNVHYTELGSKNLSDTILAAIEGVKNGTLTKSKAPRSGTSISAQGGRCQPTKETFFWRGFSSTVGHNTVQLLQSGHIEHGYRHGNIHRGMSSWGRGGTPNPGRGRRNVCGRGGSYRKDFTVRHNPYRRGY